MPKSRYLGEFEQAILLAVLRLGDGAYGLSVRNEIESCMGRQVTHGAAYSTLDRLEDKGLIQSWLGDSTPGRGGRRKRHFAVTPQGLEALRASRAALMSLWSGVEEVLEKSQ
jgi:DNA-binding PadR family transcriptional regulator